MGQDRERLVLPAFVGALRVRAGQGLFARDVAYPIMKETCEFWEDHLKALPDGKLVVPNGWSPEHGPVEDGVSYSQEIVWDLFNNYVQAGRCAGHGQGVSR